ncbi:glycosyltransferase [Dyadobacter sp. CY345]|uniref:glycosyltransferase n=1 Tax=Dyadobacter sp. CY345 TaxID=2909335 RepID=UPI001F21A2FA|nr:glycosyltransferase [Dyadobacter sp. CY345]MCF2446191.1 glycosyltransferase [Dyadobacter sp. CY345]
MQKLLFISDESPFSFDHSGAASFKTSHLMLLNEIENLEIYLLCFPASSDSVSQNTIEIPEFKSRNMSLLSVKFPCKPARSLLYKTVYEYIFSPKSEIRCSHMFPSVNPENLSVLQNLVYELQPDIIWAEHLESFLLVTHLKSYKGKVIYSHHDFLWKLILIRRRKFKDFVQSFLLQIIQKKAIQQFGKYVVGGASNELQEIQKLNTNVSTLYLPTLYPIHPFPENSVLQMPLRIIHLGSPKATANRVGIRNLLIKIIPELQNKVEFQLHLIGVTNSCDMELYKLLNQPNVICEGFVDDLKSVLHPYDLHILPYDQATGSRTRYSVAMNYGQVLVAHMASVAGIDGLVHNQNCIIENSFDGMVKAIIRLHDNPSERIRLGNNAKKWHDETHQIQVNARILEKWLIQNNIYHG